MGIGNREKKLGGGRDRLVVSHFCEFHSKFFMSLLMFADFNVEVYPWSALLHFKGISRHFSDHGSGHCQCMFI